MTKHAFLILIMWVFLFTCERGMAQEDSVKAHIQRLLDSSERYSLEGNNLKAYEILLSAKEYAQEHRHTSINTWITLERNLGEYARRTANPALARQHYMASIKLVLQQSDPDRYQLYQTYISLGTMSWYISELDSAAYFYEKALVTVSEIDDTPINSHYRRALLYNNIAGVYSVQGKTGETIRMMEKSIALFRQFLEVDGYENEKEKAVPLLFEAIDNLGGAYKELGNYLKTEQLLSYSYDQRLKNFDKDHPAIFVSQILLGQLYYAKMDYKKALQFLKNAKSAIAKAGSDYLFWDGDAHYTLALIYDKQSKNNLALLHYQKADSLYALAFDGYYDNIYLEFLQNYAQFMADNGQCKEALLSALKTFKYVKDIGSEHALLPFYQLRNLAELSLTCKEFGKAQSYAQQALELIQPFISRSTTLADSIKTEGEKAKVILLRAKASYATLKEKNTPALKALLGELYEASAIVERKKSALIDQRDFEALIMENNNLTDFIKKLNHEIYDKTNDRGYLQKGINAHETNLYTRIRSRMEYQSKLQFSKVPESVMNEEKALRQKMQTALQDDRFDGVQPINYTESINDWHTFLQKLKIEHPEYYDMRYEPKKLDLNEISNKIPKDVTVVRYYFADKDLFALVVTNQKNVLIPLPSQSITDKIIALNANTDDMHKLAFDLYQQLWQPLKDEVMTNRVIIIPDGILYHLSFEMLTPVKTHNDRELAQKCLLQDYTFSYHYSMLALQQHFEPIQMKGNFIAFAPGFFEQGKQQYLSVAKKDSLYLDKAYLSLLPLPFTKVLVDKVERQLGGHVYAEHQSTPDAFRTESAYHHIIHIGTHAEANNEYPEYSRLIFTKDSRNPLAENSVYLYDIYNFDLTSDLAVLTACESGKPGYQNGEGMISMAHAFNYAGSRSIMTGLWKLDEQTTTMITDYFYSNLTNGLPKDEALRQAKLTYLENAKGRTISPVYWAGLVLMGDMESIDLKTSPNAYLSYWGIPLLLLLGGWWIGRKQRDSRDPSRQTSKQKAFKS